MVQKIELHHLLVYCGNDNLTSFPCWHDSYTKKFKYIEFEFISFQNCFIFHMFCLHKIIQIKWILVFLLDKVFQLPFNAKNKIIVNNSKNIGDLF